MVHESKLHGANSFITLTYDDAHLPADGSLSKEALQGFFKRLRVSAQRLRGDPDLRFRYYACGEYGDSSRRPHYHAIVFGFWPHDARKWREVRGNVTHRSPFLEQVWPFGNIETGQFTPQSARYVASYVLKRVIGSRAPEYYNFPHPVTGVVYPVLPEFALMSRRPGIGSGWFDRYHMDYFPSDFCVVDGQKRNVPRFYVSKLADVSRLSLKQKRNMAARTEQRLANSTPERLAVREEVDRLRQEKLKKDAV